MAVIVVVYVFFILACLPHLRTGVRNKEHEEGNKRQVFSMLNNTVMREELMPIRGPCLLSQPGFDEYYVVAATGEIGRVAIQTKRAVQYRADCGVVKVMLFTKPEGLIFHPSPIESVPHLSQGELDAGGPTVKQQKLGHASTVDVPHPCQLLRNVAELPPKKATPKRRYKTRIYWNSERPTAYRGYKYYMHPMVRVKKVGLAAQGDLLDALVYTHRR